MKVFIEGVGVLGPGLTGWQASQAILAGAAPYLDTALAIPPNDLLPAAERRRIGLPVRLALAVGHEAVAQSRREAAVLASVFTSSSGDGENVHHICETLAANGRELSPTRFHNSVHNAPAGYWSIATKSMAPSTSLCCHDASFAAGLLEAAAQVLADSDAVALICWDAPYPQPLHAVRPISAAFGVALVLSRNQTKQSLAELEIGITTGRESSTTIAIAALEAMRLGVPAAQSLPLLAALSNRSEERVCLDYIAGNRLEIGVFPC